MNSKKLFNLFSFVPAGSVNIEPEGVAAQSSIQVAQNRQKAFSIPFGGPDHSFFTQKRGHPSKHVEPLSVLACGRDSQTFPFLGPAAAHLGMEGESCFILKNNGFTRSKCSELFLYGAETSAHPEPELGHRHDWPASSDNPTGASNTGPGAPSVLCQTVFSDASLLSGHPSEIGATQNRLAPFPDDLRGSFVTSCPVGRAALAGGAPLTSRPRDHLPHESTGSHSCGSGPKPGLSIQAVALRQPATRPRFSNQPRPREPRLRDPTTVPALQQDSLWLRFSFKNNSMQNSLCHFI